MTDPVFLRMTAVNNARKAYWKLAEKVSADDTDRAFSRVVSAVDTMLRARSEGRPVSFESAEHLAALATHLLEVTDRAELANPTLGDAA